MLDKFLVEVLLEERTDKEVEAMPGPLFGDLSVVIADPADQEYAHR